MVSAQLTTTTPQRENTLEQATKRNINHGSQDNGAREWGEGISADASLAGLAIAIVRVDGHRWTMDARLSLGFVLLFISASCMCVWIAFTQPLSVLGRAGVMAWSAFAIAALFMLRGRARHLFTTLAKDLDSNGI